MTDEKTSIIFRIERDLKEEFEKIAKGTERTVSQYLRAFIKDTVRKHQQATANAPESIKRPLSAPDTIQAEKIAPKPKKGQKMNIAAPRKSAK
jgi:predicted DNA-binding protein